MDEKRTVFGKTMILNATRRSTFGWKQKKKSYVTV